MAVMDRLFLTLGALSGFLGVGAGAFGAHALRERLDARMLEVFETAARYQMLHALALVGVALAAAHAPSPALRWAGWLFVAGTVVFSGSLYALSTSGARWLGAVTPLGGLLLLAGWLALAWGAWRG